VHQVSSWRNPFLGGPSGLPMQYATHLRTTYRILEALFDTLQRVAIVEIVRVDALDLVRCNDRNADIEVDH